MSITLLMPLRTDIRDYSLTAAVPQNNGAVLTPEGVVFSGRGLYFAASAAYALGNADWCIEASLCQVRAYSSYPSIFSTPGWGWDCWSLCADHAGAPEQYSLWAYNHRPAPPTLLSDASVIYDTWTHIAVTRAGSVLTMYLNGIPVAHQNFDGQITGDGSDLLVGEGFHGRLRDVRITQGDARYTGPFTPPATLLSSLAGRATRTDGAPADYVLIRDYLTHAHVAKALPDADGNWSVIVPAGHYDITWFAAGCQPLVHGPYECES